MTWSNLKMTISWDVTLVTEAVHTSETQSISTRHLIDIITSQMTGIFMLATVRT
jgi:hypothetical protein